MEDTRKGFLTPEQEDALEKLINLNNKALEAVDGIAIKIADNQGLERLKAKIIEASPEILPTIYEVIDSLFEMLSEYEEK